MKLTRKITLTIAGALAAGAVGYGISAASPANNSNENSASAPSAAQTRNLLAATGPSHPEALYVPVSNCRIVNTSLAGGRIPNGSSRDFYVTGTLGFPGQGGTSGGCGIPATATAVSARISSNGALGNGAFIAYPTGTPTGQGTLYYAKGVNVTTGATLQLGTAGKITVKNVLGPAFTAIDVNGYYTPQLNAYVSTNGTLTYTSGRATAASHPSTGNYIVTFDRNVSQCAYTVTPYAFNYVVAAGPESSSVNAVHVYIHDQGASTTAHDTSFFMQVTC